MHCQWGVHRGIVVTVNKAEVNRSHRSGRRITCYPWMRNIQTGMPAQRRVHGLSLRQDGSGAIPREGPLDARCWDAYAIRKIGGLA